MRYELPQSEQLHLFNPALFTLAGLSKVLHPNFPNHFGEAEHDSFVDDLPTHVDVLEFPETPPFGDAA